MQHRADRRPTRDAWTLVICLSRVCLFTNFMVVAASIPVLIKAWDLSAAQAGSIVSSFTIGYAVSLFAFSWAADHFGAKRIALVSAWASAASALTFAFFARDYTSAMLLYCLAGLMQGGTYTPVIILFSEHYPPNRRGGAVGLLIASTSVGYATSLLLSGYALSLGGYQAAFILTGLFPLAGAALLHATLMRTPNTVHPRNREMTLGAALLKVPAARNVIFGYIAHNWELLGMWAWAPAFLAASLALHGSTTVSATEIGAYISAASHILGASASLSMGALSDRLGRRVVLISTAAISMLLSFTIGWMIMLPIGLLALFALAYSFSALGDSPVLSTALTETVPPALLGGALAVRSLAGFAAGATAPLAFGLVLDHMQAAGAAPAVSWGVSFAALGIGGLLATACALGLRKAT